MVVEFAINLRWPDSAHLASDVADVTLFAREHNLTRLFDIVTNQGRDHFRASTVRLGFWFADNWWRLRWEPIDDPRSPSPDWRMAHELSSGPGDEGWPPLSIYGVGNRVILTPPPRIARDDESISYLLDRPVSVDAEGYERGVDDFLGVVINQGAHHVDGYALKALVAQLMTERQNPELAGWRRLEACLGYDPDRSPEAVVSAMAAFEERLGGVGLIEAAVASPGAGAPVALQAALEAVAGSQLTFDLDDVLRLAPTQISSSIPWQAAEDAARALREALGLDDRVSWQNLGDLLRVRWDVLKTATATARGLPFAAMLDEDGRGGRVALQFGPNLDRRFEIGRHIGDAIWMQGNHFGVVSRAKTDRQKFQRAFAQALFVPIEKLRRFVNFSRPEDWQLEQAGQWFGVRPTVVRALLMAKGVLARETLADQLETA